MWCLTVGQLKSRLFFLLARSGSRCWFHIGQLLWFQSTWKHKIKLILGIFFLSQQTGALLSHVKNRTQMWSWNCLTLTGWHLQRERDYHPEFKVAADLRDAKGAAADIQREKVGFWLKQPPRMWTQCKWRRVFQIGSDSLGCLNKTVPTVGDVPWRQTFK